jgi:hypothetical protein
VRKRKQEEQEKEGTKRRKEAEKRSFAQHLQVLVQSLCKLLVGETTGGGFETLGGDKTHCFISRTKA